MIVFDEKCSIVIILTVLDEKCSIVIILTVLDEKCLVSNTLQPAVNLRKYNENMTSIVFSVKEHCPKIS